MANGTNLLESELLLSVQGSKSLDEVPHAMPTEIDVQSQLGRILNSHFFRRSKRLRLFLSFVAKHAFSTEGQHLTECQLGVQVFGRGSAFDPRLDPIVRVEACRLRSKLKSYYTSVGRNDQLLIDFPKGAYSLVFRFRTVRRNTRRPANRSAIEVLPFLSLTDSLVDECFCSGLTEELIHQLIQIPHLRVVHPKLQGHGRNENPWRISGSVHSIRDLSRIDVKLIDNASEVYSWSESYDCAIGDFLAVQESIAKAIIMRLKFALALPEPNVATFTPHPSA